MKRLLTLLIVVVLAACCLFTGCKTEVVERDNLTADIETDVSFTLLEDSSERYYPTFRGTVKTAFLPDGVTVRCAGQDKNVLFNYAEADDGYTLYFHQILVYDVLGAGDYDVDVVLTKNGWQKVLSDVATLTVAQDYYFSRSSSLYMERREVWTTAIHNGLTVKNENDNINLSGLKYGAVVVGFDIKPIILNKGNYDINFELISDDVEYDDVFDGVAFLLSFSSDWRYLGSLRQLKNTGDTSTLNFNVFEDNFVLSKLYVYINRNNIDFKDFNVRYEITPGGTL